jgi:phosphoglycolate phosphatase
MIPSNATALIFDLDNTLIRSRIDFLALRHTLIDDLYAHDISDQPRDALVRLALPELVELARSTRPEVATHMWEIIRVAELEGMRGARAVEHANEVLQTLRARGYKLALVTNSVREGVVERLGALDLAPYFDVIVTRDEGTALKPSPEGIHLVLHRLPGVEAAYMIGDAYIDGRAAEAAGIRFIGFGEKSAEIVARGIRPWAWISDLRELLDLAL